MDIMKRKEGRGSTKEAAAKKLAALLGDFLSQFPVEERSRRIRNFGKAISALKKKKSAKSARRPRASSGSRRAAARAPFREVRRRTRPMSSFSNLESCDRIVFGITSHLNRSWERKPLFKFTQTC